MLGQGALADWLVSLGQLDFEDFCRLEPLTVRSVAADPDWPVALWNAPHVELALYRALGLTFARGRSLFPGPGGAEPDEVRAAQERLVRRHALELLREKAPPVFDCLPWHDWDFAVAARRVPVWQTRFLITGTGTTVIVCRLRRSAGVYVLEPLRVMRDYIARKAEQERVRRLTVLEGTAERTPLEADAVDLAIVGGTGQVTPVALAEFRRVARKLLVVDNDPFSNAKLPAAEWERAEVRVRGLGIRPCWWLQPD